MLERSNEHRREVLAKIALEVEAWSRKVKKEKAVFHALNLFNYDITRKALMAEAWVPVDERDRVHRALRRGSVRCLVVLFVGRSQSTNIWGWVLLGALWCCGTACDDGG